MDDKELIRRLRDPGYFLDREATPGMLMLAEALARILERSNTWNSVSSAPQQA